MFGGDGCVGACWMVEADCCPRSEAIGVRGPAHPATQITAKRMASDMITDKPLDRIVLLARIVFLTDVLSHCKILTIRDWAAGNSVEDSPSLFDEGRDAFAEVR